MLNMATCNKKASKASKQQVILNHGDKTRYDKTHKVLQKYTQLHDGFS